MIHEVDESLRAIVKREVLNGSDVEVVFDAPTKDWSSRRNTPTIDVYLYDIREDLKRRQAGMIPHRNAEGRITGTAPPPRYFKLSYLVTAWTQRPEDEHRLLSAMLACFLRHDRLTPDMLSPSLAEQGNSIDVTIALPPPEDRALSDVWSALGGELKPSLDLVLTAPMDLDRYTEAAQLVTEEPRFRFDGGEGEAEAPTRRRRPRPAAAPTGVLVPGGRRVALRGPDVERAGEGAQPGGDAATGGGGGAGAGAGGRRSRAAAGSGAGADSAAADSGDVIADGEVDDELFEESVPEETVHVSGDPAKPGRVFRLRGSTDR